jgi:hypothetical protein
MKRLCIVFLTASFAASAVDGAVIDASNGGVPWTVMPGDDLTVSILLTNGASDPAKYSVDLELLLSGSGTLPTIQSIDLLASGAIFSEGTQYPNPGQGIGTSNAFRSAGLNGDTTLAQGLLAKVVIDTTGVEPGNFTLTAIPDSDGGYTGTKVWDAGLNEIPLTFSSGTITVTPEPSALALSAIAALAMFVFHCWGRRSLRAAV